MSRFRSQAALFLLLVGFSFVGCAGNSDSSTSTSAAPTPSFTLPAGTIAVSQPVSFTDTSSGSPTTWSWTFGDGATSSVQHPIHAYATAGTFTVTLTAGNAGGSASASEVLTVKAGTTGVAYPIVDTGQVRYFDAESEINAPIDWEPFYGQDAQYVGTQPSYTTSNDGLTVKDNVTGLTWQKSFDSTAVYWTDAQAKATALNKAKHGGYSDWRLPTIKELYSLWNANTGWPYIDTTYFTISYASQDELSHAIFWSSNKYSGRLESTLDGNAGAELAFGVNFGTGHIKAYTTSVGPKHLVRCVRGASYGGNNFVKNGDGTITDQASGLMWTETDSGTGMDWEHALDYAQAQNAANFLGYRDWRLPNAKELQSLVDYTRSPGATVQANVGPAIDPLFRCTAITNEAGTADYPWYWTSTSAIGQANGAYVSAWYVAFGRAVDSWGKDLHGAGAARFDLKTLGGRAGQDAERGFNYVRLVRDAKEE